MKPGDLVKVYYKVRFRWGSTVRSEVRSFDAKVIKETAAMVFVSPIPGGGTYRAKKADVVPV